MSKIKIEVEVAKETYELGDAVASIVKSIADKKADGLSATEIATSLTENVGKIMTALDGSGKVKAEYAEDPEEFLNAVTLPITKSVAALLPKPEAPAV